MTTLIYDNHLQQAHRGDTLLDAIYQIASVSVSLREDGGWKIQAKVRGYVAMVPMEYSAAFTREEALRDAAATLAVRIPRDCSRFTFFRPY